MEQDIITILLIDSNNPKYIDGLSKLGRSFGFKIQAYSSFDEGLAHFQYGSGRADAILLDLGPAPGNYGGVAALERIKKTDALIPVIMLSGSSAKDVEMAVSCIGLGAFSFVVKTSFEPISLFQMLNIAVGQYAEKTELQRNIILREAYRIKFPVYKKMISTTEMILKNLLDDQMMFLPSYESRIKDFGSFHDKIKAREKSEGLITDPFDRFTDMAGLRVIFYNTADLEKAVNIMLAATDFKEAKTGACLKADDKSKKHGYRAVHFDLKLNEEKRMHLKEYQTLSGIGCEVQFKTIFAHSWSKVYHALAYKGNQNQLGEDFKKAAQNLEDIEQQITSLSTKFYKNNC